MSLERGVRKGRSARGAPCYGGGVTGGSDIFEVLARQRACRAFTDAPVDDEAVLTLLRAASRAPSAENTQPWRFVVVRDPGTRAAIGELMRELWEAGGRRHTERRVAPGLFQDVDRGLGEGTIAAAPVLVVVCGDSTVTARSTLPSSVLPAVQNLMVAATALGLGTCLTTIATIRAEALGALVGLPPEIVPIAVVPVGHPARTLGPSRRDPVEGKTYRDRYGNPWSP